MTANVDIDVAVAGGGIVGKTTALALADCGFDTAIVSPEQSAPALTEQFDPRTYALTPASVRIFEHLGVWPLLDLTRVAPIENMFVWDANSSGALSFAPSLIGQTSLGVMVEHRNVQQALDQRLAAAGSCRLIEARVVSVDPASEYATMGLDDGSTLTAALLACADGAASPTRTALGIDAREHDYRQSAIVCNVVTSEPHGGAARQIFLRDGPLAFLPMADAHVSSIVWSVAASDSERLLSMSDTEFAQQLENAFERRLGSVSLISGRFGFPLRRIDSRRYVRGRAVLLGDSAHVIHPLAGQGLNLGLTDAAALAEVLSRADGDPLRDPTRQLRRYERWRRSDNRLMMTLTNQLNALFCRGEHSVAWLRGMGLNVTDKSTLLKRILMHHATGAAGEVPALAKP